MIVPRVITETVDGIAWLLDASRNLEIVRIDLHTGLWPVHALGSY